MVSICSAPTFAEAIKAAALTRCGQVEILSSLSGRHDTALVRTCEGEVWFVKTQGAPFVSDNELSLAGEIEFHRSLVQDQFSKELACFVPSLVSVVENRTLIFRGYSNHVSLHSVLLERTLDPNSFARLGQFLAGLHSLPVDASYRSSTSPVITHGHVTPERLVNSPSSYARLLRLIQQAPHLNEQLRKLRQSWNVSGFIHGDMKVDNILVNTSSDGYSDTGPIIIDWELSSRGDTRWDCGSLIGSIYMTWLIRRYLNEQDSDDDDSEEIVKDYLKTLLQSYVGHYPGVVDVNLILGWAGYWLIQQILGILPHRGDISRFELATMHLAQHLLAEIEISH
jgi:Phosphotransferase enzyme family